MNKLLTAMKTRLQFAGELGSDEVLQSHLELAIVTVNDIRQFIPSEGVLVESQYELIVVEMAISTYLKEGAEGQISHDENSIRRSYESGFYPPSLLKLIIPRPRRFY